MTNEQLYHRIDQAAAELCAISDDIFDHPELSGREYHACEVLTAFLERAGFRVEKGVGGLETAFRATWSNGAGGPNFGLLCEYDALPDLGHGCGHHAQGPAILGTALALKDMADNKPFTITVYGTPAEESIGGKIVMQKNGCFEELDVALMFHAGQTTTTDIKSLALSSFKVRFHGCSAHTAMAPEEGRSALDGLMLAFQGVEYMREHVREDTRMHYTITNGGGADNVVPALAEGTVTLRSYNRAYLDTVVERFRDIIAGAGLMSGTQGELVEDLPFDSKIPVLRLNQLLMEKAQALNAPTIRPAREKTGSTDFGNVMYRVPGSCIRVAFVPEHCVAHSMDYVQAGKSEEMHQALLIAAKVLAAACGDMLEQPELLKEIREEFRQRKQELGR